MDYEFMKVIVVEFFVPAAIILGIYAACQWSVEFDA